MEEVCVRVRSAVWDQFRGRYLADMHMEMSLDSYRLSLEFRKEKAMAPHSSTLAWKISWTEETGRLQSMGWLGVGHN